jgi:hypothetical protein
VLDFVLCEKGSQFVAYFLSLCVKKVNSWDCSLGVSLCLHLDCSLGVSLCLHLDFRFLNHVTDVQNMTWMFCLWRPLKFCIFLIPYSE